MGERVEVEPMPPAPDLQHSLTQIYNLGVVPPSFRSGLIDRCERLLLTPLIQFEPGDFRVMLGQQFYPETLVPLALLLLEDQPLIDGDLYEGDLLSAVVHQKAEFWKAQPELRNRVEVVIARALADEQLFDLFYET